MSEDWAKRWDMNYENGYQVGRAEEYAPSLYDLPWMMTDYLYPRWRRLRPTDRVIEIGCGCGIIADHLAAHVGEYTGTDISQVAIDRVKERYRGVPNTSFERRPNIIGLGPAELIFAISVFQHITKEETVSYVKQAAEALAPGGALFFNVLGGDTAGLNEAVLDWTIPICEPAVGHTEKELVDLCAHANLRPQIVSMPVEGTEAYWCLWVIAQ